MKRVLKGASGTSETFVGKSRRMSEAAIEQAVDDRINQMFFENCSLPPRLHDLAMAIEKYGRTQYGSQTINQCLLRQRDVAEIESMCAEIAAGGINAASPADSNPTMAQK